MTSRAYIGEVLIQIWLKSMKNIRQTSECIKREFEKTSGVHESSCKPTKKCVMKMKERKKEEEKQLLRKNFCADRKAFIRLYQKNG